MQAKISEIFYAVQGEGIYQFIPQVFIRFWGCNLACNFCDTKLHSYHNFSLTQLLDEVFSQKGFWDSVALTGGEPLLQIDFLEDLCLELKKRNQKIYLETNGTLYQQLKRVIDFADTVSLDFKLPSSTGLKDYWQLHHEFLKEAHKKEAFVKSVITPDTSKEDLFRAVEIIKEINPNICFVLQPLFSFELSLWEKLEEFRMLASEYLSNVRIIPQLHKHIGVK